MFQLRFRVAEYDSQTLNYQSYTMQSINYNMIIGDYFKYSALRSARFPAFFHLWYCHCRKDNVSLYHATRDNINSLVLFILFIPSFHSVLCIH